MRLALRIAAIAIAIAAAVDPAIARRVAAPLSVSFQLPRASNPGYRLATETRARVQASLDDRIVVDGPHDPVATIAVGDAEPVRSGAAPVFVIAPPAAAAVRVEGITVPHSVATGQAAPVRIALHASELSGRRSSVALQLGGTRIESVEHEWTSDDERFEQAFSLAVPRPGVHRVRAIVETEGLQNAVADAVVVVRDRPLRVLVYEPRPSWPVTFVRRTLEGDAIFSIVSTSHSSRSAATRAGEAPRSLTALDLDAFDTLILGGLDELPDADWRAAERFVSDRGGTLLLLPDRQVRDQVTRRFDLPQVEEALLEHPAAAEGSAGLKGAEFLLTAPGAGGFRTLASIRHGQQNRPTVIAAPFGAGTVILSGALDAWRYRGDREGQFDRFWRGLVADAALSAPPRIDVTLTPGIARPDDPIVVRATVRGTEFISGKAGPVDASLIREDGSRDPVRLWPGPRPGAFETTIAAPSSGTHIIEVALPGTTSAIPLVVDDDIVHPVSDTSAAWRHAAAASGGAAVQNAEELNAALSRIDPGSVEQVTRPMRSPWWIVPFSLLLSAEWALRRRAGLK